MLAAKDGKESTLQNFIEKYEILAEPPFSFLFFVLLLYWNYPKKLRSYLKLIEKNLKKAKKNNFKIFEMEFSIFEKFLSKYSQNEFEEFVLDREKEIGTSSLTKISKKEEKWERMLKSLDQFVENDKKLREKRALDNMRVAWYISENDKTVINITPREQKKGASGKWTSGRPVSLKKLYEGEVPFVSESDKKVVQHIVQKNTTGRNVYQFNIEKTLLALVGHPYIFHENYINQPVEFVKYDVELLLTQKSSLFNLHFSDNIPESGNILIVKESRFRYKIASISEYHRNISEIIGTKGLTIPGEGEKKLFSTVSSLSSMLNVQSNVDGKTLMKDVEMIEADPSIFLRFVRSANSFIAEFFVKPFVMLK